NENRSCYRLRPPRDVESKGQGMRREAPRRPRRFPAGVVVAIALLAAAACSSPRAAGGTNGKLQVVAAENFWGNLAAQLGGDRVQVTSIITNPDTDPHDYEPTAADARLVAGA